MTLIKSYNIITLIKSYHIIRLVQKNILYIFLLILISIGALYYLNSNNKHINKYQIIINNNQLFNYTFLNYVDLLKIQSKRYDLFFTDAHFFRSQNSSKATRINLMELLADNLQRQLKTFESETKKNSNLVFSNISRFQSNYEDLGLIKINVYSQSSSKMMKKVNIYISNYEQFIKDTLIEELENHLNYIKKTLKFQKELLVSLENNYQESESSFMQEIVKQQTFSVIRSQVVLKDVESFKFELDNYLINKNTIFKTVSDYKVVGKKYEYNINSLAIYFLFFSIIFPIVVSLILGYLLKIIRK